AEKKAAAEAERKAKEEAEKKAAAEAERKAKEEAERKAKAEAEKKAKAEAERKAKEEAEKKAKAEAERKAKEEAERKAKAEAEKKAKEEAERKAKAEAEEKAKEEAERKAKEEAARKAEAEREAKMSPEEKRERAREDAFGKLGASLIYLAVFFGLLCLKHWLFGLWQGNGNFLLAGGHILSILLLLAIGALAGSVVVSSMAGEKTILPGLILGLLVALAAVIFPKSALVFTLVRVAIVLATVAAVISWSVKRGKA
ncbi:MAG: hypothetical protein IJM26_10260, partial [Lachnospiraceae bacterium]|nr:hypothetical protein [Lachnospiraceae bacterium]